MIERLGPYRIVREIGRGGMGKVYEGIHDETGDRAAIKVLSHAYADDENFRQRFIAEIETLKDLKHPNIVELYGDGEHDGLLFYAMEFVEGQTLQQELQAGHRFEWTEVTKIAIEICNALKHGHDHGIIHRDLKPANLLRTKDGQIKLADFGIAKSFKMTDLTAVGCIVGTADYMAPEQADGLPVGNRTDLYSLGTVMFTLLARRPPFSGGSVAQVFQRLKFEEAPPVRRFSLQVPEELEQIVGQLLAKEPEQRIPTALVLANRLKAMEHGLAAATVVDSIEAFEDPEPSGSEKVTRVSSVDDGLATEISPTAVDSPPREEQPAYSWNDATVVTTESDGSAIGNAAARADTIVDRAAPRNRFTTIEEDRQQRAKTDSGNWGEHLAKIGTILALVALAAGVYWMLLPPAPETLVARIRQAADEGRIKEAYGDIQKFGEHTGEHQDAPLVKDWRLDVECEFLFSRLRIRAKHYTLVDAEEFFVEAMKSRKDAPDVARELFEKARNADNPGAPDPITSAEAAAHQLKRLRQTSQGQTSPEQIRRTQLTSSTESPSGPESRSGPEVPSGAE